MVPSTRARTLLACLSVLAAPIAAAQLTCLDIAPVPMPDFVTLVCAACGKVLEIPEGDPTPDECPFCGKFARDTEPTLVKDYVDKGILRIEWRDFPYLGPESLTAAHAGRGSW